MAPLVSFRALQHFRIAESATMGFACPPVPPSGFGYPLDGFLLGEPCRPSFRSAALLGFALWSVLLATGRLDIPAALTHMPLADAAGVGLDANTHEQRLGFWALFPPRVPRGWISRLGLTTAGGSFGFRPFRGIRPRGLLRLSSLLLLRA